MDQLKQALEECIPDLKSDQMQKLYYIFTYNGDYFIEEKAFERVMNVWATFSASDIDSNHELDIGEIKTMWWLLDGKKPVNAQLEREIRTLDPDGTGKIDRI